MPMRRLLLPTALLLAAACALPALAQDDAEQDLSANRTYSIDENTQIGIAHFEDLYTEVLVIFHDWQLAASIDGYLFEIDGEWGPGVPLGSDITGDGQPDLVAMEFSGGAHCCFTYYIFALAPEVRQLAVLETGDAGARFVDLDASPGLEIESNDMSFAYWMTSFAQSPAPRVVWRWDGQAYVAAPALMAAPAPSDAELARQAAGIASADGWGGTDWNPDVWAVMLDLIYSGHMDTAWTFMADAWQPGRTDMEAFHRAFSCQLQASPWWPAVAELNGLPEGPLVTDCPTGS